MGVDLFFVLSGFLITGILLDTKESKGYFKNFYARRCLRIWPLYYAAIVFMFALVPLIRPSEAHLVFEKSSPWWAYPLFLQGFLIKAPTMATGSLGVTWSLAIEEQFYLVWPLVVRFCSLPWLRRIAVGVICLSPLLRVYLSWHHVSIYSNVFCRLDGLMAGAWLAMLVRSETFSRERFVTVAWISVLVAAPLAFWTSSKQQLWIVFSFTSIASASFIYLALFSKQKWLQAILANRFLIYTGTISYSLYLLQKIPFDAEQTFRFDAHPAVAMVVGIVSSYLLAMLSWNFLEKPFLRLKQHFDTPPSRSIAAVHQFQVTQPEKQLT